MMRDVTDVFLAVGGDAEELFSGDEGGSICDDVGGDDDKPLAALAT